MEFVKIPVTALKLCSNLLLAGVGSHIKIYINCESRNAFLGMKKILKHSVIHGIEYQASSGSILIFIFGGREWAVCNLKDSNISDPLFLSVAEDWIWDAVPIVADDGASTSEVALALGHNSVLLYDWRKNQALKRVYCEEKCILYSAHFIREERISWKSLILCSGTVFNQVVIWAPGQTEEGQSLNRVISRVQAHDGVIFNMNFDTTQKLLVTASDDRSIRVWKWDAGENKTRDDGEISKEKDDRFACLCKLYGHESRVWKAECIQIDHVLYLISIGEDGYCILWQLTQTEDGKFDGKIQKRIRCNKGRNIWCMELTEKSHLWTGGGDGGIKSWNLCHLIHDNISLKKQKLEQGKVANSDPNGTEELGASKCVHVSQSRKVLVHTDTGSLLSYSIEDDTWCLVNFDPSFKSYAVMRVHENLVALGNTEGLISLLQLDSSVSSIVRKINFPAFSTQGKVHNMTWCKCGKDAFLFASGPSGELVCFMVEVTGTHKDILSYTKKCAWKLPMAKHRWHMGTALVSMEEAFFLVCGDRRGSLHLYEKGTADPLHTVHGVHGKNGVTSVESFGDCILSTGRDGIWRKLKVDPVQKKIEILMQNRAAQAMQWLEKAICIRGDCCYGDDDIIILGFHGRNFTAWNSGTGNSLLSIECGGGHRDWSFLTSQQDDQCSLLAFLKAGDLMLAEIPSNILKDSSVFEESFHGGQITCVKQFYCDGNPDSSNIYLITGSEDTKLFVSVYDTSNSQMVIYWNFAYSPHLSNQIYSNQLRKTQCIDDHISNVRAVAYLPIKMSNENAGKNYEFLVVSGGGRATINCYCITINREIKNREKCDIRHVASHSLNYEKRDSKHKHLPNINPETRYMAVTLWKADGQYFIAAACSDAVMRIFSLDLDSGNLELKEQSKDHRHCFLTISHLKINETTLVIAGDTDGVISVWDSSYISNDATSNFCPVFQLKCHMSGINAIDVLEYKSLAKNSTVDLLCILLGTAGDDNAIHINLLQVSKENGKILHVKTTSVLTAHAAQITGLKFFKSNSNSISLSSVSIDQRLSHWSLVIDSYNDEVTMKCDLISSTLTNVADISSFDSCHVYSESQLFRYYFICGQGIEVHRF